MTPINHLGPPLFLFPSSDPSRTDEKKGLPGDHHQQQEEEEEAAAAVAKPVIAYASR